MSKPLNAVIRVSFAVDQVGGNLVWHVRDAEQRNLYKKAGRFAGSVHFVPGDQVYVEVSGFGPLDSFVSSKVIDAALVTVPHTSATGFSPPSPFSSERAVQGIGDWTGTEYVDTPAEALRTSFQSTVAPLLVVQQAGRWELSLVLTIALEVSGPGGTVRNVRVFSFDPESEVGTGADG